MFEEQQLKLRFQFRDVPADSRLAATRAFASAGWSVVAQVRAQRAVSGLPALAGVCWLPCDLNDTSALLAAATGCTVVIYGLNPPYTNGAWVEQAPKLMQQAIDIASALEATVMLPDNVYNFGEEMPARLREDTPQRATHAKGRVRIALEQQLAAATSAGKVRGVVIRAGDFIGSGRGSMFDLVIA